MKFNVEEFYPTPKRLLDKVMENVDCKKIVTILEPQAGKGDIVEYLKELYHSKYYNRDTDIDCIEKDSELRSTLKGKGFRVVHDDFLTFNTFKKYDLIIMNPPFSNGAAHLSKALKMQEDGGAIICILNAETLKNPCTNERMVLVKTLNDLQADIQYMQGEFISSEHPTGVEIAVIKVFIPKKEHASSIYEELKKKTYAENVCDSVTDVAPNDYIDAIVSMYNIEVESGVRLIQEYRAMCPHLLNDLSSDAAYNSPILEMKVNGHDLSVNRFVREVRKKYWNALFNNKRFTGNMTSNLASQYHEQVHELANYDFSVYNIKCIQLEMSKNLVKGIEDCIIELFDKLSHQYSYSDELKNNIHYYNGWKTNKAWYINSKVIIPWMNAFSSYSGNFDPDYKVTRPLEDIEKALNYLDGGLTECRSLHEALREAKDCGQTKKIRLKYFYVTFYKKGTCHIEFINEELLKKFNIFGSQQKGWLPPGYGKKAYSELEPEEKKVVDEFEGEIGYRRTLDNADYYIYNPQNSLMLLDVG